MRIGKVIRKYRKSNNMTQEEMAGRLGITAPAVNKWENGNSFPDIMLLAPIARLLGITVDTLLSFREDLTDEEIKEVIYKLDSELKEKPYDEVFQWAKKQLEQYPNCEWLIWQMAVILDVQRIVQKISNGEEYDEYLQSLYSRVLESGDETLRSSAAGSLFGFHMRQEQYDKAEAYLNYFSSQDPERKRKQAQLYSETGRIAEAYKLYEELLFVQYETASAALHGMYMLAIGDKNMEKARMLAAKQEEMARCFEMGKYYEVSARLDLAAKDKDTETVIETVNEMISGIGQISSFCKSPLYEHMKFQEPRKEFLAEVKQNLLGCFRDEACFDFLKDDERWRKLTNM